MKIMPGDYVKAKINADSRRYVQLVDGFVEVVYENSVDIIWQGGLFNIKKSEIYYVKVKEE